MVWMVKGTYVHVCQKDFKVKLFKVKQQFCLNDYVLFEKDLNLTLKVIVGSFISDELFLYLFKFEALFSRRRNPSHKGMFFSVGIVHCWLFIPDVLIIGKISINSGKLGQVKGW
jgi:hypothetical protein